MAQVRCVMSEVAGAAHRQWPPPCRMPVRPSGNGCFPRRAGLRRAGPGFHRPPAPTRSSDLWPPGGAAVAFGEHPSSPARPRSGRQHGARGHGSLFCGGERSPRRREVAGGGGGSGPSAYSHRGRQASSSGPLRWPWRRGTRRWQSICGSRRRRRSRRPRKRERRKKEKEAAARRARNEKRRQKQKRAKARRQQAGRRRGRRRRATRRWRLPWWV